MHIVEHQLIDGDGDVAVDLPRLAFPATVTAWRVPAEYRANCLFVAVTPPGTAQEVPACDHGEPEFTAQLPAHDDAILTSMRASMLLVINAQCERRMRALVEDYPEQERQTFSKQEGEARACTVDQTAATPMIDALAEYRNIEKEELVSRIIGKADIFAIYSGRVIGYRQRLEDQILAASTQAALEVIDPTDGWPA